MVTTINYKHSHTAQIATAAQVYPKLIAKLVIYDYDTRIGYIPYIELIGLYNSAIQKFVLVRTRSPQIMAADINV